MTFLAPYVAGEGSHGSDLTDWVSVGLRFSAPSDRSWGAPNCCLAAAKAAAIAALQFLPCVCSCACCSSPEQHSKTGRCWIDW